MLLGDAVLSSSPLSSLGVDPGFGTNGTLESDELDGTPQYIEQRRTGPQYEATLTTNRN